MSELLMLVLADSGVGPLPGQQLGGAGVEVVGLDLDVGAVGLIDGLLELQAGDLPLERGPSEKLTRASTGSRPRSPGQGAAGRRHYPEH